MAFIRGEEEAAGRELFCGDLIPLSTICPKVEYESTGEHTRRATHLLTERKMRDSGSDANL